ncbi:MAG: hypothetical protein K0S54_2035 [Alphaproteobacteria bacterium]|jgi:hypothetical protein|nr:hypothetical protein [Alphaproteobacteria bacterium]
MNFPDPVFQEKSVPAEASVRALAMAEMFALWAIRLWVSAYRSGGSLLPQLRQGFVLAGMPRAWLELDEFMTRLLGSVTRPLDIRAVAGKLVSPDESGMLRWLAGLQQGDLLPAYCPHLRAIAAPGRRLAQSFAAAKLHFQSGGIDAGNERPSVH